MEELAARFVHALILMRAKIVALRLEQVRWQASIAITVVIVEGG